MLHIVPSHVSPMPLAQYLPLALDNVPAWALRRVLRERQIKRAGKRLSPEELIYPGDELTVYFPKGGLPKPQALPVLFQDEQVVLIEKPQGMGVRAEDGPGSSVEQLLLKQLGLHALWPCHRLDYHTGGILLLAKEEEVSQRLREDFTAHRIQKEYVCRVVGTPAQAQAELHAYLRKDAAASRVQVRENPFPGAKPITTGYRVLEAGDIARLSVSLITGRTHQIRAHLAFIGHPVLGDDKYGEREINQQHHVMRQQLWATGLYFTPEVSVPSLAGHAYASEAPF